MATKFINLDNLSAFLAKLKTLFTTTEAATTIANTAAGTARTNAVDDVKKLGYQTADDVTKTLDGKGYQTAEQVETAITGKGYDTATSVDKKVSDAKTALQDQITAAVTSVYNAKGSSAFADLPAVADAKKGDVYNITNAFTTTADFVEGAGKNLPAGTNIMCVEVTTGEGDAATTANKWDSAAGMTDLSGYYQKTDLVAATNDEIDALFA
ncbi:hypothetical protein JS528_09585 [Bifidobacterium sp. MA2]|uniref:Tail protein n=1 Tax=Bifidobacterium santillanense TaxID=2809028 RepID=A0ABS5URF5_9BIFI|nr:hypothetical protein [Bifidobacterium santillanense]MBT1173586.1 hypothetical protein [Bifidobacterium santillanense]